MIRGAAVLWLLLAGGAAFAQVSADGSTATTVTLNPNGSVTVGIAPTAANGVSLNRYDALNVPKPGLALDNRTEAARTIVNEVTGTGQTTIAGDVSVLGQRAHVIVANPNGIVVDAGRFINTGRVALTTGRIGITERQIAPGIFQDNVTATVTDGTIRISGGGLSGQMDAVDLIAREIYVDGPITNTNTAEGAGIRLFAGSSAAEFESAIVPGNTALSWGNVTGADATSDGSVLVEITSNGALRANRIGIVINDKGAGARIAGEGLALARDFSLSADGRVTIDSARLSGQSQFSINAGAVVASGAQLTSAAGAVAITADDVSFDESRVDAATAAILDLTGSLSASDSSFRASTGVIFDAPGGLTLLRTTATSAGGFAITTSNAAVLADSTVRAAGNGSVVASDLRLTSDTIQSALVAESGSLVATIAGDLINDGGLLQGGTAIGGVADAALTVSVGGDITQTSAKRLAVMFAAGGDAAVTTAGAFRNFGGRLLGNGDVRLTAGTDMVSSVPGLSAAPVVTRQKSRGAKLWWSLGLLNAANTTATYDYGVDVADALIPIIQASGDLTIAAANVTNSGGNLNANSGDLTVRARSITNEAAAAGAIVLTRSCGLVCTETARGSAQLLGGGISAGGSVSLTADATITNRSGAILGLDDVTLNADLITVESIALPILVRRPAGLYNLWVGKGGWVVLRDQAATIAARDGTLTALSPAPVRLLGGTLTGGSGLDLQNGQDIVRKLGTAQGLSANDIGLLRNLPLIRED